MLGYITVVAALLLIAIQIIKKIPHGFIITFALCTSIACMITSDYERSIVKSIEGSTEFVDSVALAAMSADSQISGQLGGNLLGVYGTLSQDSTYSFLYVTEDGGYKKRSVQADRVTIYEVEDNFRLETYEQKKYKTTQNIETKRRFFKIFWREPIDHEPTKIEADTSMYEFFISLKQYKAYIPSGSILNVYEVM